jgi:hypothetical protein
MAESEGNASLVKDRQEPSTGPTLAVTLLGKPSVPARLDLPLSENAVSRIQRGRAHRPSRCVRTPYRGPSVTAGLDLPLSENAVSRTKRGRAPRPAAERERRIADPARPRALTPRSARSWSRGKRWRAAPTVRKSPWALPNDLAFSGARSASAATPGQAAARLKLKGGLVRHRPRARPNVFLARAHSR